MLRHGQRKGLRRPASKTVGNHRFFENTAIVAVETVLIMPRMHVWALSLITVWACAADPLTLRPPLQRLDLAPSDVVTCVFTLAAPPGTTITHTAVDCACLKMLTALPVAVGASGNAELRLRVTGMRPGVEDILVGTSAGIVRAQLQIVGPGAGRGIDQLRLAIVQTQQRHGRLLAIAHDVLGKVRNCGCSSGSLGGAGRLARLPSLAREIAPSLPITWLLTGDADGPRVGVGEALVANGWHNRDLTVQVADDPLPLLAAPGLVAVVTTGSTPVQHRRIVRPVLTGGLAVELLLIDDAGSIQGRWTMPVDDSLPDDVSFAVRFPDQLTRTIRLDLNPSQACAACHATAYAAWQQTRHAHALNSLPAVDRTDACIACHTTVIAATVVAPAVSCQSCHIGSDAHVAGAGQVKTTGTSDCRSCHDARHNPTFRREVAWPQTLHGREPATPTKP